MQSHLCRHLPRGKCTPPHPTPSQPSSPPPEHPPESTSATLREDRYRQCTWLPCGEGKAEGEGMQMWEGGGGRQWAVAAACGERRAASGRHKRKTNITN